MLTLSEMIDVPHSNDRWFDPLLRSPVQLRRVPERQGARYQGRADLARQPGGQLWWHCVRRLASDWYSHPYRVPEVVFLRTIRFKTLTFQFLRPVTSSDDTVVTFLMLYFLTNTKQIVQKKAALRAAIFTSVQFIVFVLNWILVGFSPPQAIFRWVFLKRNPSEFFHMKWNFNIFC